MKNKLLNFFSIFLYPISFLWELVYRIRRFCFNYGIIPQKSFQVPIISIGNLTFGGTGKTPFTLWLADYLAAKNKKVMVLMRGYKGSLENSSGILKSERRMGFNPLEYGDEALLLARRLEKASIVVGKNRGANLDYYFEQEGPDVVLLDDGHQHLKIHRNTNIVLFDALLPINRYKVAPMGYMREGMTALADADLVIIGRSDQVPVQKIEDLKEMMDGYLPKNTPFAEIRYRPVGLYNTSFEKVHDIQKLNDMKVICVAGIASPISFYNMIESSGANILKKYSFPDHHYFKTEEIRILLEEAENSEAIIVTTEKDMVKIRRIIDSPRILYLEIKVDFLNGEERAKEIIANAIEF